MEELIKRLQETVGITAEDAQKTIATTLDFIKEKLPLGLGDKLDDLISGNLNINNLFGSNDNNDNNDNPLDKLKNMFP